MLKPHWGKLAAIVLTVAVSAGAWLGISDLSTVDQSYIATATDRSHYYSEQASGQVREKCAIAPGVEDPDCADKIQDTARKEQREEQDLAAQKVTAWWTKIMGIAAVIGMTLSAAGVVLVWTTFQAARKGNRIAAKTAKRQLRAYLNIRNVRLGKDNRTVWCEIENSGETPAYSVKIVSKSFPPYDVLIPVDFGMLGPRTSRPHMFDSGRKIDLRTEQDAWLAEYTVEYRDAFKRRWGFKWSYYLSRTEKTVAGERILHISPNTADETEIRG